MCYFIFILKQLLSWLKYFVLPFLIHTILNLSRWKLYYIIYPHSNPKTPPCHCLCHKHVLFSACTIAPTITPALTINWWVIMRTSPHDAYNSPPTTSLAAEPVPRAVKTSQPVILSYIYVSVSNSSCTVRTTIGHLHHWLTCSSTLSPGSIFNIKNISPSIWLAIIKTRWLCDVLSIDIYTYIYTAEMNGN